jgi:hypothetical protein
MQIAWKSLIVAVQNQLLTSAGYMKAVTCVLLNSYDITEDNGFVQRSAEAHLSYVSPRIRKLYKSFRSM